MESVSKPFPSILACLSLFFSALFLLHAFNNTAKSSGSVKPLGFLPRLRPERLPGRCRVTCSAQILFLHRLLARPSTRRKGEQLEREARTSSLSRLWFFGFVSGT